MDQTQAFEVERPRLVALAARVLGDRGEAEDAVQQAWLRLHRAETGRDVTRERRVRRTCEELEEGRRRSCCWPGCSHRERTGR